MTLEERLIKADKLLSEIEHTYNLRWWNYATLGTSLETADLNEEKRKIYFDDSLFEALKEESRKEGNYEAKSRKAKLYLHQFYINRVELDNNLLKLKNEIIEDELSSVSTIAGKEYSIKDLIAITQNSLDSYMHNEARKRLEELNERKEEKFIEIIRLRNESSRKLGFKSYIDIYFYGLEPNICECIDFVKKTIIYYAEEAEEWENWLKSSTNSDEVDKALRKIQEELRVYYNVLTPEETFINILKVWGLEKLLTRIHIFTYKDSPNKKHWWTFCQPINIPDDIRISINELNPVEFVETFYHELGHAIHCASIEKNEWIFKKEDLFTEIPVSFMANICSKDEWIEMFLKIKDTSIKEKIKRVSISRDPVAILSRCLDFLLIVKLYEEEKNPNKIFGNLYKRIFGYRKQGCSSSKKWNFEILFAEEPFYGLFHLIGEIVGEKILDFLLKNYGNIFCKNVGEIIQNKLFSPGNSVSWTERVNSISPTMWEFHPN